MAKYGRKQKTNIELNMDHAHEDKEIGMLGGVDLNASIIPLLSARKDDSTTQLSDLKVRMLKAQCNIESSHVTVKETKDAIRVLEEQKQRAEDDFKRATRELESTHVTKMEELKSVEDKIDALRNPVALEASVSRCMRQCSELEAQRKRNQDENLMRKHAVLTEINDAMRICSEYREYQHKTLKNLKGYITAYDVPKIELSTSDEQKLSSN